jgi:predicted acylesterase/phospholipase RssA
MLELDQIEEPLEVQIALQGGGAKLYSLLIAMREVEKLEGRLGDRSNAGSIKVTHLAGTSAGAIVAALYAARVPMEKALDWLQGLSLVDALPPHVPQGKRSRLAARLCRWLANIVLRLAPDRRAFLHNQGINLGNIVLGYPAYDSRALREQLRSLFNKHSLVRDKDNSLPRWGDFDNVRFGQFGTDGSIALSVVRTELRTRRPEVASPSANFLNFLVDSAAIPFLFRNVRDPNWDLLDGGICANLPAQFLNGTGRVAIGFHYPQESAGSEGSKWHRLLRLLDTIVDYSVERSIEEIGDENCCKLSSKLSTYDFASIVGINNKAAMAQERQLIEDQTSAFFSAFLARSRAEKKLQNDPWRLARARNKTSRALLIALESLGSLSSQKFAIIKHAQDFVLTLDPKDPRAAFRAELCEERTIDADANLGADSDHTTIRYLKVVLACPDETKIEKLSCLGFVDVEERTLAPIPCLPADKDTFARADSIKRAFLFDLKPILDIRRNIPGSAPIGHIRVRWKLTATDLIKCLCNSDSEGEEFLVDLGTVGLPQVDVEIKVHMPDQCIDACRVSIRGGARSNFIKRYSDKLFEFKERPTRSGFGYVLWEAKRINVMQLSDKKIGMKIFLPRSLKQNSA